MTPLDKLIKDLITAGDKLPVNKEPTEATPEQLAYADLYDQLRLYAAGLENIDKKFENRIDKDYTGEPLKPME